MGPYVLGQAHKQDELGVVGAPEEERVVNVVPWTGGRALRDGFLRRGSDGSLPSPRPHALLIAESLGQDFQPHSLVLHPIHEARGNV